MPQVDPSRPGRDREAGFLAGAVVRLHSKSCEKRGRAFGRCGDPNLLAPPMVVLRRQHVPTHLATRNDRPCGHLILGARDREVACSRLPIEASPITLRCGSRSDRFVVASLIKDAAANIERYLAARGEAELVAQDAVVGAIASTQG